MDKKKIIVIIVIVVLAFLLMVGGVFMYFSLAVKGGFKLFKGNTVTPVEKLETLNKCQKEEYDPSRIEVRPYVNIYKTMDRSDCYDEYMEFQNGEHSEGYTYADWQASIINDWASPDEYEYNKRKEQAEGKEQSYNVMADISDVELEPADPGNGNYLVPDGWYAITKKVMKTLKDKNGYTNYQFLTPELDRGYGEMSTVVIFDETDKWLIHVSPEFIYYEQIQ